MEPTYAAKEGKDEAGAEKRGGAGGGEASERRARGRSDETTERQEKGGRRMEGDETTVVKWMRRAKERRKGERKRERDGEKRGEVRREGWAGEGGETRRASSLVYSANGRGTDGEKERGRDMAGRRGEIGHKKLEEKLR